PDGIWRDGVQPVGRRLLQPAHAGLRRPHAGRRPRTVEHRTGRPAARRPGARRPAGRGAAVAGLRNADPTARPWRPVRPAAPRHAAQGRLAGGDGRRERPGVHAGHRPGGVLVRVPAGRAEEVTRVALRQFVNPGANPPRAANYSPASTAGVFYASPVTVTTGPQPGPFP